MLFMKEIYKIIKDQELVECNGRIILNMKVIGKIIYLAVKVSFYIKMGIIM